MSNGYPMGAVIGVGRLWKPLRVHYKQYGLDRARWDGCGYRDHQEHRELNVSSH